jgi:hypothetical protein
MVLDLKQLKSELLLSVTESLLTILHFFPYILNWIHIWVVSWPFDIDYRVNFITALAVWHGAVLHESGIVFWKSVFRFWKEAIVQNLNGLCFQHCPIYSI